MAKVKVTFEGCIQDSQDFGSDDEHMVSRLFFSIEANGNKTDGLSVDVKQTVGATHADPIEVGGVAGHGGPFDHEAFRQAADDYFHKLIGPGGAAVMIGGNSSVRMRNNRFMMPAEYEFESAKG